MRFFRRLADFRLFWTKTIISEIDANPLRSQNAMGVGGGGGGGGPHKLSPNIEGRPYSGVSFSIFTSTHSHP